MTRTDSSLSWGTDYLGANTVSGSVASRIRLAHSSSVSAEAAETRCCTSAGR